MQFLLLLKQLHEALLMLHWQSIEHLDQVFLNQPTKPASRMNWQDAATWPRDKLGYQSFMTP